MQKFKDRLKYYIIGILIGLILTYIFFGNRGCAWLPENRVKNMIAEKEILVGDSVKFLMECSGVDHNDIYRLLEDEGDVNFSKSKTREYPKIYWFNGKKEGEDLIIEYALYDTIAEVVNVKYNESRQCATSISNRNKTTVPLPDAEVIEIIDSKKLRILDEAKCQMECYGISEKEIEDFHRSAQFVVEKSNPRKTPNPEYVMKGEIGNKTYEIFYIIGDNRTRIADIQGESPCKCPK